MLLLQETLPAPVIPGWKALRIKQDIPYPHSFNANFGFDIVNNAIKAKIILMKTIILWSGQVAQPAFLIPFHYKAS